MNPQEPAKLRRATRYYFGGVVELNDLETSCMIVAMVRSLNLYGCFVKTDQAFKLGTKLLLTMTHSGTQFEAYGQVVNQNEAGIGVEFTEIDGVSRSRLKDCLSELAEGETVLKP